MRRRAFGAWLIGAGLVLAPHAFAQQGDRPVIGFLSGASAKSFAHLVAAFREALAEEGFVEGSTVDMEFRWADGQYDRLPGLAAELVDRNVSLIVCSGGDRPTLAAKAATTTIPIVFVGSDDPIRFGLVESLSQPGGNLTGATLFTSELETKKLELLHELVPNAKTVGMLANPNNPTAETDISDIKAVAARIGKEIILAYATSAGEIDQAFAAFGKQKPDALLVGHDPFFNNQRAQIVPLVSALAVPAIYEHREFVDIGGLMSYGNIIAENYRMAGHYAGRILKGAKPADLPVQQATKFELAINLETAGVLGLGVPDAILVRADHVVE